MPRSNIALRLHASGLLRERALQWWQDNMGVDSTVISILLKGDGFLRFEWKDQDETGSYHVCLGRIYK